MCGVLGFWSAATCRATDPHALLRAMSRGMRHRGPDDNGEFYDDGAGLGLGHLRLSIVDLSAQGHQPMRSASGRYVLSYNGEIYNHPEMRARLTSQWRGTSD